MLALIFKSCWVALHVWYWYECMRRLEVSQSVHHERSKCRKVCRQAMPSVSISIQFHKRYNDWPHHTLSEEDEFSVLCMEATQNPWQPGKWFLQFRKSSSVPTGWGRWRSHKVQLLLMKELFYPIFLIFLKSLLFFASWSAVEAPQFNGSTSLLETDVSWKRQSC